jgi:hypothetical protein
MMNAEDSHAAIGQPFNYTYNIQTMSERNVDTPLDRPVSDETLLKVAKEIVIKFIEVGRLTPATFEPTFESIYQTIKKTVRKA